MSRPAVSASRIAELVQPNLAAAPSSPYRPTYHVLADALRILIADGQIPAATKLPSERALTAALPLSRTTVSSAYAHLRDQGYLTSQPGSGSVAALPEGSARRGRGLRFHPDAPPGTIDLTCAALRAPAGMTEAAEAALAAAPEYLSGTGYVVDGLPELRAALAQRFADRGLPTDATDIVVTTGAMSAFSLVVRALVRPADRVLVESPSYPNFFPILDSARARLVSLPVTPSGWDLSGVPSALRSSGARLAVLMPDFHNPSGHLMSDEQRAELASVLRRARTTAVVDETMVEIDLNRGEVPRPFAAHHSDTIVVGGASKSHWGGLRVGWYRANAAVRERLADSNALADMGTPILEQLMLVKLMQQPTALAEQRLSDLRGTRDTTAQAVAALIDGVKFVQPRGGLSLWLEFDDAISSAVALAAETEGLMIASGPTFAPTGGMDRFIRLPYVLDQSEMAEAVKRLARAVDNVRSGQVRPSTAARRSVQNRVA